MPRASLASIPLCLHASSSNVDILVLLPLVQLYASTRQSKARATYFYHSSTERLAVGRVAPTPRTASARPSHRLDISSVAPTKLSVGRRSILMNTAVSTQAGGVRRTTHELIGQQRRQQATMQT